MESNLCYFRQRSCPATHIARLVFPIQLSQRQTEVVIPLDGIPALSLATNGLPKCIVTSQFNAKSKICKGFSHLGNFISSKREYLFCFSYQDNKFQIELVIQNLN
ncbi:unnamed protein product [Musa hybrid cultivar]